MGSGTFGKVEKVCQNKNCTECFAVKTFFVSENLVNQSFNDYSYERYLTNKVHSVLKGTQFVFFISNPVTTSKLQKQGNVLITEYFENALQKNLKLTIEDIQAMFIEIFGTLDYLWTRHKILHMDLKVDNIIVTLKKSTEKIPKEINFKEFSVEIPESKLVTKIIDWGLSVDLNSKKYVDTVFDKTEREIQGQCYSPFFDTTHFLESFKNLSPLIDSKGKLFIKDIISWIYGTRSNFTSLKKRQVNECLTAKAQIKSGILKLKNFRQIFLAQRPNGSNMFLIKKK